MFVHGVPRSFLEVGDAAAEPPQPGVTPSQPRFTRGGYFIGKGVWGKGPTPQHAIQECIITCCGVRWAWGHWLMILVEAYAAPPAACGHGAAAC